MLFRLHSDNWNWKIVRCRCRDICRNTMFNVYGTLNERLARANEPRWSRERSRWNHFESFMATEDISLVFVCNSISVFFFIFPFFVWVLFSFLLLSLLFPFHRSKMQSYCAHESQQYYFFFIFFWFFFFMSQVRRTNANVLFRRFGRFHIFSRFHFSS